MNNLTNRLQLSRTDFSLQDDFNFLVSVFTSVEGRLFWCPAGFSFLTEQHLLQKLENEWGEFKCFIGKVGQSPEALFSAYNVSKYNKRADVMTYINQRYRNTKAGLFWYYSFLNEISSMDIRRVYCKIIEYHSRAIKNVQSCGFEKCGYLPEFFRDDKVFIGVYIFSRLTSLSERESAVFSRFVHQQGGTV